MRVLLIMLATLLMTASCSKGVRPVEAESAAEPLVLEEKSIVELRLSNTDLSKYTDQEQGVWTEARLRGLRTVFNRLLEKNTTLMPVSGTASLGTEGRYVEHGTLIQTRDPETGDYVQDFDVMVRFIGDVGLGGQVVTLEENRYVAGMTDVAYGMFFQRPPARLPAFAAIAEPVDELGRGLFRLIGMAEVQQVLPNTLALPTEYGSGIGKLCTLEILTSSREVEAGDMLFLLTVHLDAQEQNSGPAQESWPEIPAQLETVVVQPMQVDTVTEPTESK